MSPHPTEKEWQDHLNTRQQMQQSLDTLVEATRQQSRLTTNAIERLDKIERRLPSPEQEKFSNDFYKGAEIIGTIVRWTKNGVVAFAAFVAALAVIKSFFIEEVMLVFNYFWPKP